MNVLRKVRITVALLFWTTVTLLFLDFTGTVHLFLGWTAKIQFLPALFALNAGVVIALIAITLLLGRVYCSVICPLGIFQDIVSRIASTRQKNRFRYSPAIRWLRYGVLCVFVIAFIAGIGSFVALLEPYSSYGRIASNLFAPVYQWGNNLLAYFAERLNSYAFYRVDVWIKGLGTFIVSVATLLVIAFLAWRNGRTYCNTVCPAGTFLGFLSRFSLYKHRINTEKCNGCGLCARNCKASCIDSTTHTIDYSRCVACFDCIDQCRKKAITYGTGTKKPVVTTYNHKPEQQKRKNNTRRNMLAVSATLLATSIVKSQEKKIDGGLALIKDKKFSDHQTPIVPPGAHSYRHFTEHCTGCQLCVSVCPNQVLRPSTKLTTFMQPEMTYEKGYCRPECTKCSEVCPSGAIEPVTRADKSSTQIGHAVWIKKNCVVITDGVSCGNCERHCPVGAIQMVTDDDPENLTSRKVPVINTERCIGCGACENLCPARPFSAIYVEGHFMHRII